MFCSNGKANSLREWCAEMNCGLFITSGMCKSFQLFIDSLPLGRRMERVKEARQEKEREDGVALDTA